MDPRLERERQFHDQAYAENARAAVASYYVVTDVCWRHYRGFIDERAVGRDLLEYGCGMGGYAIRLAMRGARVTGIDLSDVAIAAARRAADAAGAEVAYHAMDAEQLAFPDDSFDLVYGAGILHHLDLDRSLRELARVLRPDGAAIFLEPLGHNPFLNLYRRMTSRLRTEDEHPLRWSDLRRAEACFGSVELRVFNLTTLFALPLLKLRLPGLARLLPALHAIDRALFASLPFLRRYAWNLALVLRSPRPEIS